MGGAVFELRLKWPFPVHLYGYHVQVVSREFGMNMKFMLKGREINYNARVVWEVCDAVVVKRKHHNDHIIRWLYSINFCMRVNLARSRDAEDVGKR